MEILTSLVRIPDVAFISWERFPNRRIPDEPVPVVVPDFVAEIVSQGNTIAELARKRREYFEAGVRLVWIVDRFAGSISAYTSETAVRIHGMTDIVDGGEVLPGFRLSVAELFGELDRHG